MIQNDKGLPWQKYFKARLRNTVFLSILSRTGPRTTAQSQRWEQEKRRDLEVREPSPGRGCPEAKQESGGPVEENATTEKPAVVTRAHPSRGLLPAGMPCLRAWGLHGAVSTTPGPILTDPLSPHPK